MHCAMAYNGVIFPCFPYSYRNTANESSNFQNVISQFEIVDCHRDCDWLKGVFISPWKHGKIHAIIYSHAILSS